MAKPATMAAAHLLPGWLTERLCRPGEYGLVLVTGRVLAVEQVTGVHQTAAGLFLDVRMMTAAPEDKVWGGMPVVTAPTGTETDGAVNVQHVVAAFAFGE